MKETWRIGCFLVILLAGCATGEMGSEEADTPATLRTASGPTRLDTAFYEIRQSLTVTNRGPDQPSKHHLWLALIKDRPPYQEVQSISITPSSYQLMDDEYGNQYAEFDLADLAAGASVEIQVQYQVAVQELVYDLTDCQGVLPRFFTQPELHIESKNIQIVELANRLSRHTSSACEKVEAFYDYVGDELVYSYNGADWGAQAALGEMGADCTEFASLMIALSRAAGIPARYLEGLHHDDEMTATLARQEHAWLEVYLPGVGWIPMDPTLGRSSLTRDRYFARHTAGHIIVTQGRNPSVLRGSSYFTHLYWPGDSAEIKVSDVDWSILPIESE